MAFSNKQLGLLNQVREIDNPKVRKELIDTIHAMEANRDAHLLFGAANRRFNEILGEEEIEDDPVDLIVDRAEALVVRLTPQERDGRKATPAGRVVRKTIHRPLEARAQETATPSQKRGKRETT